MSEEKRPGEVNDESAFPRRRRRGMGDDASASDAQTTPDASDAASDSTPTSMDTPDASEAKPAAADQSADSGSFRRRRGSAAGGSDNSSSAPAMDTTDGSSKAPAKPEKPAKPASPAPSGDPKRGLRIVILLMLVGIAGFWMFMMLGSEVAQNAGGGVGGTIGQGPADKAAADTKQADTRAAELSLLIKAGDHQAALEKAELSGDEVESVLLRRQIYLARAVAGVLANAAELKKLPSPEPANASLQVQVNVQRQEARIPYLARLATYRRDWGRTLTDLPEMKPVYETYAEEISTATGNVSTWGAAAEFLDRARAEALKPQPNFETMATLLRAADSRLPLEPLGPIAEDVRRIGEIESSIDRRELDAAVNALGAMTIGQRPAPKNPPETALGEIQLVLRKRHADAKTRIGAWGELQALDTQTLALHSEGRTSEALAAMQKMLDSIDRTNPLTREVIVALEKRQAHYQQVIDAYQAAMKTKAEKGLDAQLREWAAFQDVIDRQADKHYFNASIDELKLIKEIIQKRIAAAYDELIRIGAPYKPITARMRRPESPRGAYAEQAAILQAMAKKAVEIIETNDLVSSWRLGDTTEDQVNYARSVLSDHADQSQRLWNLSALYRERGRLREARECAQRVLLLGDVGNNPWHDEAQKWIDGGAEADSTDAEGTDS